MGRKKKEIETKADYVILDSQSDNLLKDTTVKEKFQVFRISQRISKYLSSLLFVTGAVSMLLSAEYILDANILLSFELKMLFILSLGFVGVVSLVSGLLLLSKE